MSSTLTRTTRSGRPHALELASVMDVTDANVDAFLSAERAALILIDPDASFASTMRADLDRVNRSGTLGNVRLGVLDLTAATSERFRRPNPWREAIAALPYVALYRDGRRVDGFVAYRAATVTHRMDQLAFLAHVDDAQVIPHRDSFVTAPAGSTAA